MLFSFIGYSLLTNSKNTNTNESSNESTSEAKEYYESTSKIVKEEYVNNSNTLSEKEVIKLLDKKGFYSMYSITYDYSIDGKYVDETEVDETSNEKHPMYKTFYSGADTYWTIYIIGKNIYAYPVSYMLDGDATVEILVSESNTITSYDDEENKFFVTMPMESEVKVITVKEITPKFLDSVKLD